MLSFSAGLFIKKIEKINKKTSPVVLVESYFSTQTDLLSKIISFNMYKGYKSI